MSFIDLIHMIRRWEEPRGLLWELKTAAENGDTNRVLHWLGQANEELSKEVATVLTNVAT
jgi:hypothetical protein